jgi:hypothetical protein
MKGGFRPDGAPVYSADGGDISLETLRAVFTLFDMGLMDEPTSAATLNCTPEQAAELSILFGSRPRTLGTHEAWVNQVVSIVWAGKQDLLGFDSVKKVRAALQLPELAAINAALEPK